MPSSKRMAISPRLRRPLFLRAHVPLIRSSCRSVPDRFREDAESDAVIAFLVSLKRFEPTIGAPLGSYAKPRIEGAIKRHVGHSLSYEQRIIPIEVDSSEQSAPTSVLSRLVHNERGDPDLRVAVQDWLDTLSEIDRTLLHLRFWQGVSQADIARLLRISRAAVSKRFKRILAQGQSDLVGLVT